MAVELVLSGACSAFVRRPISRGLDFSDKPES